MSKNGQYLACVLEPHEVDEWVRATNNAINAISLDFVGRVSNDGKFKADMTKVSDVNPLERSVITAHEDGTVRREIKEVQIEYFLEQ
jgi:hypothetical protein